MGAMASVNEKQAESAFTTQSVVFDELYSANTIVNYKRERVRNNMLQFLKPQSHILELNSGTGEDAIFFAQQGHCVHATDISAGMQGELKRKALQSGFSESISTEICSY